MSSDSLPQPLPVVGWREWVSLPDLGISHIKAKVDTGAKSSSLHAINPENFRRGGTDFVRFEVHPHQRSDEKRIMCEAPLYDIRMVRSSSGEATERFVIQTSVRWRNETWLVEVTLADRTEMGFRMLLGREALRRRVLVDSSRSFCGGRLKRKKKH
ncbi:ATP-dependent zinc protease [Roseiconus nitratireducens]|uniref:ATP-dependent zinc protease n=1 Tax=Roseiconus nitratireducens TaxID=2605748 RepID=A0A5M6D3D0_9BACT|nr:RimK/LysX family protein [Roseiconus nitratireducens]KAA5541110.1 ATP-dependent zinc protease [Roseiconus nitratireducens]